MWLLFVLGGSFFWALLNVLDSLIVKHFHKQPVILMWSQSFFSVPVLVVLYFLADVQTSWKFILIGSGLLAYVGDLLFFKVLDRVDASMVSGAWAILSLLLALTGLLFFSESWTSVQSVGVLFVLTGVFLLSFYHRDLSPSHTFSLLFALALSYLPFYIIRKMALVHGQDVLATFYWSEVGREFFSFLFPWFIPSYRTRLRNLYVASDRRFFLISATVICCFFLAEYLHTQAYAHGPLSLVVIAANVQPFIVISLAWLLFRLSPHLTSRELLTTQSVQVKIVCFAIVFVGLALLALIP